MTRHFWTVNGDGEYRTEHEARLAAETLADEQNAIVIVARDDDMTSAEIGPRWQREEMAEEAAAENEALAHEMGLDDED